MTKLRRLVLSTVAVVALVAIAVTGGETFGATLLQATFRSLEGGGGPIAPLPVTFWDHTGLVTAIEPLEFDSKLAPDSGLYTVPGSPKELVARWVGGACEDHVTVTLGDEPEPLELRVDSSMGLATLGCPAVGILRDLKITFSREVSPDAIVLTQDLGL